MNAKESRLTSFRLPDEKLLGEAIFRREPNGDPQLSEDQKTLWIWTAAGFYEFDISNPFQPKLSYETYDGNRQAGIITNGCAIFSRYGGEKEGYAVHPVRDDPKQAKFFEKSEPGWPMPSDAVGLGDYAAFFGREKLHLLHIPQDGLPSVVAKYPFKAPGGGIYWHAVANANLKQIAVTSGDHALLIYSLEGAELEKRYEFYPNMKTLGLYLDKSHLYVLLEDETEELFLSSLNWQDNQIKMEYEVSIDISAPGRVERAAGLRVEGRVLYILTVNGYLNCYNI